MKSWPLRVKLVVLMLVLLAAALITTATAGVYSTRDFLLNRLDSQLLGSVPAAVAGCPPSSRPGAGGAPKLGSGYYVACVGADGAVYEITFTRVSTEQSPPDLSTLHVDGLTRLDQDTYGAYETVDPVGGKGHQWRVLYVQRPMHQPGNRAGPTELVVAISLDEADATVARQAWTSVIIGGFVLVVLAAAAYLLVRSSLRPLVEVEQTAEAIAAGDLSRRVPEADPRTEVGGLSTALNTMLGQIETAFDERRASEAAARASEERMRRFVADASHELRTPLTSIRGFAELHRHAGPADENIARIEHHATRMGLLVDDLLLLARMDQHRPLEHKPVDLLTLATDALVDARVTANDHRLRLRTATTDDDEDVEAPVVLGDDTRLRQVLQNLLSNALHHTPAGTEVTVYVGTEHGNAILEVADNGPGMTEEDAARVFERFYRTDPSRTRALGGSGLGLSIVAALVEAHGGTVALRTAPGEGATFRVAIPLLRPA
ncbi:HAMP domain-containing sensor histidine kinase [Dactylosporangium sp. NPDC051485]|uniref:HAMP domain-containing sensor histidine kinase n=1 Tax=Dactylosporangium sp. NPDC051485 TaxID=3154846 RepID=UPI00341547C5